MKLSVVIAVSGRTSALERCIASLERLDERPSFEIVAAARGPAAHARQLGVQAVSGDLVAFLGDHYEVTAGWAKAALDDSCTPVDALAGPVLPPAGSNWASLAAYLWEYGHLPADPTPAPLDFEAARLIPAGNVRYGRNVIERLDLDDYRNELDYHASLFRQGATFAYSPAMAVECQAQPLFSYLRERYLFSKEAAAGQARGQSLSRRFLLAASRLALPPVLMLRSCRRFFNAGRGARDWLSYLPLFACFSLVQAAGETTGYISSRAKQRIV